MGNSSRLLVFHCGISILLWKPSVLVLLVLLWGTLLTYTLMHELFLQDRTMDFSTGLILNHHYGLALPLSFTEFRGKATTHVRDLLNPSLISNTPCSLTQDLSNIKQEEGTSYPLGDPWTWFTPLMALLPRGMADLWWDQINRLHQGSVVAAILFETVNVVYAPCKPISRHKRDYVHKFLKKNTFIHVHVTLQRCNFSS